MSKIRVKDLAKRMGIPGQDLVFKLKSLGARIESEDAQLDTDAIQAILAGKRLAQPREVILRDDAAAAAAEAAYQPVEQGQPSSPLRPSRRAMIQRVESRIRTIEIKDRQAKKPEAGEAGAEEAPAAVAAGKPAAAKAAKAKAKAPEAKAPADEPKKKKTAARAADEAAAEASPEARPAAKKAKPELKRPARSKARARLISKPDDPQPAGLVKSPPPPPPRRPPASRPTAAALPPRPGAFPPRPGMPGRPHRPGVPTRPGMGTRAPLPPRRDSRRRRPRRNDRMHEVRSYQRVRATAPADAIEAKPSSERGRRRLQARQDAGPQAPRTAEIPAFKDDRPDGPVTIAEGTTVREFAEKLGVKSKDLIKALVMRGVMANINDVLDSETAQALAGDLGVEVMEVTFEEEVQLQHETELADGEAGAEKTTRAPVVTVMGHVDHGKTTLLDAIRESEVAAGEAGGITQHIGAYHVDVGDKKIVFLDTPGHEAFTLMRARGAQVTDLVVLVVAADDGVMPQTIEAIEHARAAKVPIIVAVNKIDKSNANPDRVKKELADHDLMVEEWGGDTVAVPLSALKKEGVSDLLEMILINAELLELQAQPEIPAQGTVLEARKDIGRGIVATILVLDGTLRVGDTFVSGSAWGRVRSMVDDRGHRLEQAAPATPIEVTGFNDLPAAGDPFQVVEDELKARGIAEFRQREERQRELAPRSTRMSLSQLFERIETGEAKELPVVVKADVHGSVEVLKDTLTKLSTEKVRIEVIRAAVGAITTNDVIFAMASNAIVIGFNVRPERMAANMAEKEDVDIRLHTVIYELSDEIKAAMAGLLEPVWQEKQRGVAEVRETFKVPKFGTIAGCYVTEGVIPRNAGVRLLRDNRVVYEGKIASLKRFKDDASEVRTGFECGIGLDQFQDVKPGDLIEAYVREEVAQTL